MKQNDDSLKLLVIGGLLFLGFALWCSIDNYLFLKTAVSASGQIIDSEFVTFGRSQHWNLKVKFKTTSGDEITTTVKTADFFYKSHEQGSFVSVFYDPIHPMNARSNSFIYLWESSISLFILSASCFSIAFVMFKLK
ncbi:MAG TPA: DUF3592 domain-containing protein [bacterium]|jgi:hypothetical protein|nr:DUF3592 domain-containing protein [bacterium]